MNALMSSRPRRGSCSEYLSSMSGAAISSITPRLTRLPQNSVNQRPTTALLSSCLLIGMAPLVSSKPPASADDLNEDLRLHRASHTPFLDFKSEHHLPSRFSVRSCSRLINASAPPVAM